MDPTLSWIDASEVQAAIAHVRRAGPQRVSATPEPENVETLAPIAPLREPPTVAARVQALALWVEQNLRPQRWFLADAEGLPIHDAGFGEARIGELIHWMREWRPGGRPTAIEATTYHLSGGRRLIALWVATPVGPTAIALENPLVEALSVVRQAVEYAFRGEGRR